MFFVESETAADHGRFGQARELTRRAADSARRAQEKETAAEYEAHNSVREGLVGLMDFAKENAQAAIEALSPAAPYELGHTNEDFTFALYPIYFRGQAYLAAKNWAGAAAEFQKILDHPGIVGNEPIGALAHLGLARANSLSGNRAK